MMISLHDFKFTTCSKVAVLAALAALLEAGPVRAQEQLLSSGSFTNSLTGEKVQLSKHYDFKTRRIVARTSNPSIASISQVDSLAKQMEQRDFRKYGRVGPQLRRFIDNPNSFPDTGIEVTVYLRMPFFKYIDKTKNSETSLRSQSETIRARKPMVSVDQLRQRYTISESSLSSVSESQFQIRLDRNLLEKLREDDAVAVIEEFQQSEPAALGDYAHLDFRLFAWSAFNPSPLPAGCRGEGVNVATAELGIWEHALHCLAVNTPQVFITSDFGYIGVHSNQCFACLVYASPGANHYQTDMSRYGLRQGENRDYRMANNIRAMSESYKNYDFNNPRKKSMARMDEWIYEYPYTLFCNPAMNDGEDSTTGWSCYNHLNVGSCRHVNLSRYEVADFTSSRNPTPRYGGPWINDDSTRSDRELPHILTPGLVHTDNGCYDYCLNSSVPGGGTSYSAPIAVGLVANVISAGQSGPNWEFNFWPELVRATLMLTAQDCDGLPYQGVRFDGRDGLGVASGYHATQFALNSTPYNGTPNEKGFHVASWRPDQTDPLQIYIKVPQNYPGNGKHLRVLLTWNSVTNADASPDVNELSDLDLTWSNNGVNKWSLTWNNNVEVIEIPWSEVVPASVCSVTVEPFALRFPENAKQDFFYYAVVWDWVLTSAPVVSEPSAPPVLEPYPVSQIPPGAAQLMSPLNGSLNHSLSVTLAWGRASYADSYIVQLLNGGTIVVERTIPNKDQPSTKVVVNYNTRYTWRVGAVNLVDTVWCPASWAFTTMPVPKPTLLLPYNGHNTDPLPTLWWGIVPGAISYTLKYWRDTANATPVIITGITTNSYRISNALIANKQYCWTVQVVANEIGEFANPYILITGKAPPIPVPATSSFALILAFCVITGMSIRSFSRQRKEKTMRTVLLALCLLFTAFVAVHASDSNYPQYRGILNEGNDYLAIFSIDYTDSLFEGGYLYEFSSTMIPDTMPLRMTTVPPLDMGQVSFKFTLQNDIEIFRGGVVWMGTGQITIPDTIFSPKSFSRSQQYVPVPESFSRFSNNGFSDIDSICSDITFAWERISNLNLVHSLIARKKHYVAFYLYPPSVGAFNPAYAKVLIFVYASKAAGVGLLNDDRENIRNTRGISHPNNEQGALPYEKHLYTILGKSVSPYGAIAPGVFIHPSSSQLFLQPSHLLFNANTNRHLGNRR